MEMPTWLDPGGIVMWTFVRLQLCETDHSMPLTWVVLEIRVVSMLKLRTAM